MSGKASISPSPWPDEDYGLEILKVREIIGMMDITAIPQTPPYVKGVINLRGKVIPVIDLRLKFSLPPMEYGERTCIIVVDESPCGRCRWGWWWTRFPK
jgi:purine-binding chemotaxis protein CheW